MFKNFIKCFSQDKAEELQTNGYQFLYEQNGVYYFEDNENLNKKFSNNDILNNTQSTKTINL